MSLPRQAQPALRPRSELERACTAYKEVMLELDKAIARGDADAVERLTKRAMEVADAFNAGRQHGLQEQERAKADE